MLEKISFEHFFIENKSFISERFLPFINPHTQTFWKGDGTYFALTEGRGFIYVAYMGGKYSNNIDGMRDLIKSIKDSNITTLKFGTFEGNDKILTFYKYIGAVPTKRTENYYSDGKALLEYELELAKSKRFSSISK